ncbi:unnamed protein product [Choristocarpus tenellus]
MADEVTVEGIGDEYHISDGEGLPLVFKWDRSMYTANVKRHPPPEDTPLVTNVSSKPVRINIFHRILNHAGKKILRHTAGEQDIQLSGNLASTQWVGCAKGIRIKDPVSKSTVVQTRGPFTHIFIDLMGPKKI